MGTLIRLAREMLMVLRTSGCDVCGCDPDWSDPEAAAGLRAPFCRRCRHQVGPS